MGAKIDDEETILLVLSKIPRYLKHCAAAIRQEKGNSKRKLSEVFKYLIDEADIEQREYKSSRRGKENKDEQVHKTAFSVKGSKANPGHIQEGLEALKSFVTVVGNVDIQPESVLSQAQSQERILTRAAQNYMPVSQ